MSAIRGGPPALGLDLPVAAPGAGVVVARGAGHDLIALRRAEGLGVVVGAAVRVGHGHLEVGAARRGPLDRRPRLALDDLFEAAAPGTSLMLDLRGLDPRLPRLLARATASAGARELVVCSRTWWMLESLRGRPGVRIMPTVASARQLAMLLRRCDTEPLDGVAVATRLLTEPVAAALRAMAGTLMAWPVDSAAEAERLHRWGVRGLITDRPAAFVPAPALAA